MIRINLIGGAESRRVSRVPRFLVVPPEQRAALLGVTVLMATAIGVAGWWWSLDAERRALDAAITQQEAALVSLRGAARLVEAADVRTTLLRERLAFIDRLRATQRVPARLLDTVRMSVHDDVWLVELKQQGASMHIDGRAVSVTAVMDFVDRLQASNQFQSPVDIVTTSTEAIAASSIVRFVIRGDLR